MFVYKTEMSSMLHSLSDIDFSTVCYTNPKKVNGHYCIRAQDMKDEIPGNLYFQTPKMTVKGKLVDDENKQSSFIDTMCDDETFIRSIDLLDEHVFNIIKDRRDEWFPSKNITDTFLEVGQTRTIMKNNVIRFKLDNHVNIFNHDKDKMDPTDVHVNATIKCIVQFVGVWFTATRWGITLNIVQTHVYPMKRVQTRAHHGYMFPDDDESVEEDEESCMPIPPPGV